MKKITAEDVRNALEDYEDSGEAAQMQLAADQLGLNDICELIEILQGEE